MTLQKLTRDHKRQCIQVLTIAFHDYPVMRFILRNKSPEYESHLEAIIDFYCEARFAKDRPVLGIMDSDSLVAVALLDVSSLKPWAEQQTELERLKKIVGDEAYARVEVYERTTAAAEPSEPHHFLGMMGVLPEHRGKNYGRILLEEVKKISAADPQSSGVCLTTEDLQNVRYYERCGYKVISETDIAELHSWCMFLPTR